MSKAGDVVENPVIGERGVARIGTAETGGELLVADLYIRPGGAVMGELLHPAIEERFTVLRSRVGFRLAYRAALMKMRHGLESAALRWLQHCGGLSAGHGERSWGKTNFFARGIVCRRCSAGYQING
jgi:hypothetical protein